MKPIWYGLMAVPSIVALYVAYHNWPWWEQDRDKWFEMIMPFVIGCLITVFLTGLCGAAAAGLSSLIGARADNEWRVCWKAKMVSLRNADGIRGSISGGIFMLVGQVESQQMYFYYTAAEDGSFRPHKWRPDSRTRVFEEERTDGEVIQWDCHLKHAWLSWFTSAKGDLSMDFHIPKGSLRQSFSLQ